MRKYLIDALLLILVIVVGNSARSFSYATVPAPGENSDEYAYAWAGLTLLTKGIPEAWSQFPQVYKNVSKEKINVDHLFEKDSDFPEFTIVSPWFDNPPMLGVITGGFAYLKGFRNLEQISVITIRRPMLKIAIVTTILLYVLGTLIFNKKIGFLASLLYSVMPVVVISSRLALAENALAPLFLLSAIFAVLYLKKKEKKYWVTACISASVSILFKLSGVGAPLALLMSALVFGGKKKQELLKDLILISGIAIGAYILYGAVLDWGAFIRLFLDQSKRFYGASSEAFYQAFTRSKITKYLTDGWLNMAWVSAFILTFRKGLRKKGYRVLITYFLFSYLIVFLIMGSEAYGHYRIPFYPFLIICASKVLVDLFKKPNMFVFLGLMLLPLGTTIHRLIGVMEFQKYVSVFRYGLLIALVIYLISLVKPRGGVWLERFFMLAIFILAVALSVKEIYFFNIDKWYWAD